MKKMMRQKIDFWVEDCIGKTKSEVTQTARSDDRAKRAKTYEYGRIQGQRNSRRYGLRRYYCSRVFEAKRADLTMIFQKRQSTRYKLLNARRSI